MIPAPPGLIARYKQDESSPLAWDHRPVIAFGDDGHPLVIGGGKRDRSLVRAGAYSNYDGLGDDPYPPVVALLPAGGWRVAGAQDDGTVWSQPLVGWGLRADGSVVPLDTDGTGCVEELDSLHGKYRVYHPDAQEPQPPGAHAVADLASDDADGRPGNQ